MLVDIWMLLWWLVHARTGKQPLGNKLFEQHQFKHYGVRKECDAGNRRGIWPLVVCRCGVP